MNAHARRTVALRREEILDATVTVLARVGLAEVRVADVATELGVSAALVFYHFGSKNVLIAEAFDYAFARDLEELNTAIREVEPVARLRAVAGLFVGADAPLGWQLWIDACAVAHRQPPIQAVMRRIDRRYAVALCEVIEAGVADGSFVCPDPVASVERILALNDGLSTAVMVLGSVTPTQLSDWMIDQIALETGLDAAVLRGA